MPNADTRLAWRAPLSSLDSRPKAVGQLRNCKLDQLGLSLGLLAQFFLKVVPLQLHTEDLNIGELTRLYYVKLVTKSHGYNNYCRVVGVLYLVDSLF